MRLATGDILTWLNSDDMLAPGALYAMALAFYYSRADIISGVVVLRNDNQTVARHITGCCDGSLALRDLLDLENCWQKGQFWYQPETFFTRRIWEKAGSYVREDLFWSMDYDLWLRFAEQGANLHAIGRDVAWFRLHEEQKTHGQTVFLPELQKVRDDFIARTGISSVQRSAFSVQRSLRFLFFNDLGPAAGAGIGHTRIARALAAAGHDVRQLALAPVVISTRPKIASGPCRSYLRPAITRRRRRRQSSRREHRPRFAGIARKKTPDNSNSPRLLEHHRPLRLSRRLHPVSHRLR